MSAHSPAMSVLPALTHLFSIGLFVNNSQRIIFETFKSIFLCFQTINTAVLSQLIDTHGINKAVRGCLT